MNKIKELFNESIKVKQKVVADNDSVEKITQMAELISNAIENGNKLLLCGNGGSAADAQHLAAELIVRLRPDVNRRALVRAKEIDVKTCVFLGCDGGEIKSFSDIEYIVPSNETGRVQEVHIMLGHALMETIEDRLLHNGII
jgi:D-sedoheptulose 7-phosphate isomerase